MSGCQAFHPCQVTAWPRAESNNDRRRQSKTEFSTLLLLQPHPKLSRSCRSGNVPSLKTFRPLTSLALYFHTRSYRFTHWERSRSTFQSFTEDIPAFCCVLIIARCKYGSACCLSASLFCEKAEIASGWPLFHLRAIFPAEQSLNRASRRPAESVGISWLSPCQFYVLIRDEICTACSM
jgi:hypothetical protein